MAMEAEISLRKSYGSVFVILKIVRRPGWVISSKFNLVVLEQNVLEVIDCEGRTKFDILLTTGAKASLGSFEMASIVLRIISSWSSLLLSIASISDLGSEMKSTRMRQRSLEGRVVGERHLQLINDAGHRKKMEGRAY